MPSESWLRSNAEALRVHLRARFDLHGGEWGLLQEDSGLCAIRFMCSEPVICVLAAARPSCVSGAQNIREFRACKCNAAEIAEVSGGAACGGRVPGRYSERDRPSPLFPLFTARRTASDGVGR